MNIRDDNNPPRAGTDEVHPKSTEISTVFDGFSKTAWGVVSVSAACVGITAYQPLSEATSTFTSILMSAAIAASAYWIMGSFYAMGARLLPDLPKGQRAKGLALFSSLGLLVGTVGAVASLQVFAGTPAEGLEQKRYVSALERSWNEASTLTRQFYNAESDLRTGIDLTETTTETEWRTGGYCGSPGDGPCTAALRTISNSLTIQLQALLSAKNQSRDLIAGGNYEIAQIKVIEALENKSLKEKGALLEARAEKLADLTNRLIDSMPVATLRAAQAAMSPNFEAQGFSQTASAQLRDQYQDTANRLGLEALRFDSLSYRDLTVANPLNGLEAVSAHATKLLPLIAVAVAPDFLMLGGLFFLLLLHWNKQDRTQWASATPVYEDPVKQTILLSHQPASTRPSAVRSSADDLEPPSTSTH